MIISDLTANEELFCLEYYKTGNATQSAQVVHSEVSASSARQYGYRYMKNPDVIKRIEELRLIVRKDTEMLAKLSAEAVLTELMRMLQDDIGRYFYMEENINTGDLSLKIKNIKNLDTRNIHKIKQNKDGSVSIELYDKTKAIELLGKYLSLFIERTENINMDIQMLKDDELNQTILSYFNNKDTKLIEEVCEELPKD